MSLLSENNGRQSLMRWSVMAITISCVMLIHTICFNIIVKTLDQIAVDWVGIAALIGAIAGLMTGILAMKSNQKGKENEKAN